MSKYHLLLIHLTVSICQSVSVNHYPRTSQHLAINQYLCCPCTPVLQRSMPTQTNCFDNQLYPRVKSVVHTEQCLAWAAKSTRMTWNHHNKTVKDADRLLQDDLKPSQQNSERRGQTVTRWPETITTKQWKTPTDCYKMTWNHHNKTVKNADRLRASLSGTFRQRKDVVNRCLEFETRTDCYRMTWNHNNKTAKDADRLVC